MCDLRCLTKGRHTRQEACRPAAVNNVWDWDWDWHHTIEVNAHRPATMSPANTNSSSTLQQQHACSRQHTTCTNPLPQRTRTLTIPPVQRSFRQSLASHSTACRSPNCTLAHYRHTTTASTHRAHSLTPIIAAAVRLSLASEPVTRATSDTHYNERSPTATDTLVSANPPQSPPPIRSYHCLRTSQHLQTLVHPTRTQCIAELRCLLATPPRPPCHLTPPTLLPS